MASKLLELLIKTEKMVVFTKVIFNVYNGKFSDVTVEELSCPSIKEGN